LKNVRIYAFEDILKNGRNVLISGLLVLFLNSRKIGNVLPIIYDIIKSSREGGLSCKTQI